MKPNKALGTTTSSSAASLTSPFLTNNAGPPDNIISLSFKQFIRNGDAIRGEYYEDESGAGALLSSAQIELQAKLRQLTLNSTAIWEKELENGPMDAPLVLKIPYLTVCYLLDVVFEGRYVPSRFYLLETVARMPYFSYITMLHLYETLGFWRRSSDVKRIHFSQEINEYRHLLIMESLGGDQRWIDRFTAQHSAIVYFLLLCLLFLASPSLSYRFSELLETHAVHTYGVFLDENEKLLKELPPPLTAVEYYSLYSLGDPFYAEFQTSAMANGQEIRRPGIKMTSLYDVFNAIRADEGDHVQTMNACLDTNTAIRPPSIEKSILTGLLLVTVLTYLISMGGGGSVGVETSNVVSTITDSLTSANNAIGGASELVDSIAAGAPGFDLLNLGTDITEIGLAGAATTFVEKFRRFASILAEFLTRFL